MVSQSSYLAFIQAWNEQRQTLAYRLDVLPDSLLLVSFVDRSEAWRIPLQLSVSPITYKFPYWVFTQFNHVTTSVRRHPEI